MGAALVLAVIGVLLGFAAGLANIDKRTTMTRILIGLAIVHCAPLIIMVWSRLLLGGE